MGCIREKQGDFLNDRWACPECGQEDGVELMSMTPVYMSADVVFRDGHFIALQTQGMEIYWEGAEEDIVYCLNCRAELELEVDYT